MLRHGGRVRAASERYGIASERWLDLSTGISPWSWIEDSGWTPSLSSWTRLPEEGDGLEDAAAAYYGAAVLPCAGSQRAIELLPRLHAACHVGVLHPTYSEHAEAWRRAGHRVSLLKREDIAERIDALDVLVLCHPNNPDGARFTRNELLSWHAALASRAGWLVVDEAFADAEPVSSLAADSARDGLIVLRSLGKFFGLAGARIGFVLCAHPLREALRGTMGPWPLSGPAREIATQALRDARWQSRQKVRLAQAHTRLVELLTRRGLAPDGGCALFQYVRLDSARRAYERLAVQGILVRRFREPEALRFGLPRSDADWRRLDAALSVDKSCAA